MILVTGGSGRLGTELKKLSPGWLFPTRKELDITNPKKRIPCDLVVHAAAYTDVAKAEKEGNKECFKTNIDGTRIMLDMYKKTPFVYISSEYAVNPVNWYSKTKKWAEKFVADYPHHLIIRTLFKPRPYPYDRAWTDQFTMGDYVDVIAKLIKLEVDTWDRKTNNIIYVGTGRKSIYDLAKQTRPDVKKASLKVLKGVELPFDYI